MVCWFFTFHLVMVVFLQTLGQAEQQEVKRSLNVVCVHVMFVFGKGHNGQLICSNNSPMAYMKYWVDKLTYKNL